MITFKYEDAIQAAKQCEYNPTLNTTTLDNGDIFVSHGITPLGVLKEELVELSYWQSNSYSIEWLEKYNVPYTVNEEGLLFILESIMDDESIVIAYCANRDALEKAVRAYVPFLEEEKIQNFLASWTKKPVLDTECGDFLAIRLAQLLA